MIIPAPERVTAGNGCWYLWFTEAVEGGLRRRLIVRVMPR